MSISRFVFGAPVKGSRWGYFASELRSLRGVTIKAWGQLWGQHFSQLSANRLRCNCFGELFDSPSVHHFY